MAAKDIVLNFIEQITHWSSGEEEEANPMIALPY